MLFLVQGNVFIINKRELSQGDPKREFRLVEADSQIEAEGKFALHFVEQDMHYPYIQQVDGVVAHPVIK